MGFPASRVLDSPLAFFMKTEGPERDPTWVQSLPNEAQRCFCKHALEIASGLYDPEINGALSATTAEKYSVELLQKTGPCERAFHHAVQHRVRLARWGESGCISG